MEIPSISTTEEWVIRIGAVSAALLGISAFSLRVRNTRAFRWVVFPIRFLFAPFLGSFKLDQVIDEQSRQSRVLGEIVPHFRANGGSSLVDLANANKQAIIKLTDQQAHMGFVQWLQMEQLSTMCFVCDMDGRNLRVTQSYADFLNVSKQTLKGFGWKDLVVDLDTYERDWRGAFADGRPMRTKLRFRPRHRAIVEAEIELIPEYGVDGKPVRYVGMVYPIDDSRPVIVEDDK